LVKFGLPPDRKRVHPPQQRGQLNQSPLGCLGITREQYLIKRLTRAEILQDNQPGVPVAPIQAWRDRGGAGNLIQKFEPRPIVE
jgi:hypothetical protein